jgi:transcriptional regulator with XRE-family HTH domain
MQIVEVNIDYKIIGKRIKDARMKANMTQQTLGEMIDSSTVYLSRIERGETHVNLKRLMQISVALKVSIQYLVTGAIEESEVYLNKEFQELLNECTPDKQRLIYNIAKIVAGIKFV